MSQNARVEDDDLDDLDDVLDQFSASAKPTSPSQQAPPLQPSTPGGASTSTQPQPGSATNEVLTDDFAAELAKGMESLFKDLGIEPGAGSQGPDGVAERERLAAAWEAMLIEEMDAMSDPSASHAPADASPSKPKDFQSHIRSTMNKLKETESSLKSSDSTAHGGSESLESLLRGLDDLSGDEKSEEELQGILEAMMGQLMSKDVLYEPLKELHEKFPGYLAKNDNTLSPEDRKRFEAQISCIEKLLAEFEAKTYRDEDGKIREKIVQLMSELQAHGSPPEEIMGPLPPGFNMAADGLPDCNIG